MTFKPAHPSIILQRLHKTVKVLLTAWCVLGTTTALVFGLHESIQKLRYEDECQQLSKVAGTNEVRKTGETERINVINPRGVIGSLEAEEINAALAQGYKIASPEDMASHNYTKCIEKHLWVSGGSGDVQIGDTIWWIICLSFTVLPILTYLGVVRFVLWLISA